MTASYFYSPLSAVIARLISHSQKSPIGIIPMGVATSQNKTLSMAAPPAFSAWPELLFFSSFVPSKTGRR